MAFETNARRQAKVLFDELSERLLKDLAKTAQEEAEAAAARAKQDAETAAAATLSAARAEAQARLADAQSKAAGLLEKMQAAEKEAQAKIQATEKDAQTKIQAAEKEAQALKASAKADAERARTQAESLQARGDQLQTKLDQLQTRVDQLQQERKEILKSRDEAATRHEAELKRAKDLGQRLETETKRGRELSESLEAETLRGTDLAARLESELRRGSELAGRLEGEMRRGTELAERVKAESRRAAESDKALDVVRHDREAMIERVSTAIKCIDRASSPAEILETLLDPLARDFAIAAVFLVGPAHVRGWQARGLATGADITKLVIPRDGDSLLARAVHEQKRAVFTPASGKSATGVWGTTITRALAMPILASGRVIAVAYAEDAETPHTSSFPGPGCQIVELLIDHASLRLTAKGHASPEEPRERTLEPVRDNAREKTYSPARQARRLKKRDGLDVTVDGEESSLVDVSASGAQILSPLAMRPNRVLRLMLRAGERALACKARVMWARFEQARGAAAAHYRVGVKFTDVDQKTVEAFLSGDGVAQAAR
jgi:hypothetical protein